MKLLLTIAGLIAAVTASAQVSLFGLDHLALGQAQLSVNGNELVVGNLGASGNDGVQTSPPQGQTPRGINVQLAPQSLPDIGDRLTVTGTSIVNGSPTSWGEVVFERTASDVVAVSADYSALGATEYLFVLVVGGLPVASATLANNARVLLTGDVDVTQIFARASEPVPVPYPDVSADTGDVVSASQEGGANPTLYSGDVKAGGKNIVCLMPKTNNIVPPPSTGAGSISLTQAGPAALRLRHAASITEATCSEVESQVISALCALYADDLLTSREELMATINDLLFTTMLTVAIAENGELVPDGNAECAAEIRATYEAILTP